MGSDAHGLVRHCCQLGGPGQVLRAHDRIWGARRLGHAAVAKVGHVLRGVPADPPGQQDGEAAGDGPQGGALPALCSNVLSENRQYYHALKIAMHSLK